MGGCDSSPHGINPLWHVCPPTLFIQCQERQQEQNQPSQPSEGIEGLSITHSEVFLVMLVFSHPGQQRETPSTAWLGVGLFGHHFGHSPGIACSSCVLLCPLIHSLDEIGTYASPPGLGLAAPGSLLHLPQHSLWKKFVEVGINLFSQVNK